MCLGCCHFTWSFTVQIDVCTEFDTRMLFSHSSAGGGKFICAHLKSQFEACNAAYK